MSNGKLKNGKWKIDYRKVLLRIRKWGCRKVRMEADSFRYRDRKLVCGQWGGGDKSPSEDVIVKSEEVNVLRFI